MKTFKALEVERISDAIYKAIIEQRLKAGTRLVETRLADIFSANRNHVRAAIEQLSLRRVVTVETNKGAFVSNPGSAECKEIFMARRILECGMISDAARKCTSDDLRRLKEILDREKQARNDKSRHGLVRESGEFHLELARILGNVRLYEMLEELVASSSLVAGLYEKNDDFTGTINEHDIIFNAIRKKDYDSLPELMAGHLSSIEKKLLLRYQEQDSPNLESIFA
ncbi:GntR family transcriptional regulator [Endozoicomonas lisbonensis]|uniref:DNA-binding GntR family transcriptional regulator n=1 Tax=Endozoicomonas lisbonensis TaxID=3120522 RepID=A0ABV2SEE7_9GAMM